MFTKEEVMRRFVKNVCDNCDNVYVPQDIDNELRGAILLHLMREFLRELGREKKFHRVNVEVKLLPNYIKRRLRECGADHFNLKVAELAYRRREIGQSVYLVSKDRCLQGIRQIFEHHGINVRTLEEFEKEYLGIALTI
jgi:hypothetical protein